MICMTTKKRVNMINKTITSQCNRLMSCLVSVLRYQHNCVLVQVKQKSFLTLFS